MEKKIRRMSEETESRLKHRQICVCGRNTQTKAALVKGLRAVQEQNQLQLEIVENSEELKTGALILVNGEMNGSGSACFEQFEELMIELELIGQRKPEAVLYLSDSRVYGKKFGPQTDSKEEELGYVCHTRLEEMDRQCMRMAEYMVCRMAQEQKLPVNVVRLQQTREEDEVYRLIPGMLEVLLNGKYGEVFNLADVSDHKTAEPTGTSLEWTEERSPLAAMEIRMNTEKVRNYVASELFE